MMADYPGVRNELTGSVDAVVQAGAIQGDVNLYLAHRLPKPNQLPTSPTKFVNRLDVIRQLDLLAAGVASHVEHESGISRVSAITGSPGVGKTAVALYWAHQASGMFADGNLYVDMRGFGSGPAVSPGQALDAFLRALDVPAEKIPESVDQRANLFRSLIGQKNMLVLIDNVSSSEHVRYLIPSSPQSFVLVTSRNRLRGLASREGAVRVQLDVLTPRDAIWLLTQLIGEQRVAAEQAAAERIADLCGYLPLTLRVVAERAASRPESTLASVVEELVGEQNRLDAVASSEDELSDTRAIFSWSYHKLPAELATTFRLLALHPTQQLGAGAAAALIGDSEPIARRRLRELADVHLVAEHKDRFTVHDLLYSYAKERVLAEEGQGVRTLITRQCLVWYLLMADAARKATLPHSLEFPLVPTGSIVVAGFPDAQAAMRWFSLERLNLLAAIRLAHEVGQYDLCWKLASVASSMFEVRCYWTEWEENHLLGFSAARMLGDVLGEAAHTALLGDIAVRTKRFEEAGSRYRSGVQLARQLSMHWLEGFMLRGLGLVAEGLSDPGSAAAQYRASLEAFQIAGHERGKAMSLLSLGTCARATGDVADAVSLCADAVQRFVQLDDPWSTAWGRLGLAACLRDIGDRERAIQELSAAATTFLEFEDKVDEASALCTLGELLTEAGDHRAAHRRWSRAVELYDLLGDSRAEDIRAMISRLRPAD